MGDDVEYNTLKARPNILSQTLSNPERAEKLKVYILEQNIPAIWHLLTERKLYIDKEKTGFQHLGRREISYQEGSDAQPESDAVMFYLKHFNSETPPLPQFRFIEEKFMWEVWLSDVKYPKRPERDERAGERRRMPKEFDAQSLSFEPYNYAAIMIGCFTILAVITGMYLVLP